VGRKPKIKAGQEFEVYVESFDDWKEYMELRQRHRMEYIVPCIGVFLLLICIFVLPPEHRKDFYFTAILSIAVGCIGTAIGGALDVKYTGNRLKAQGTLGFGAFLLVLILGSIWAHVLK
jgi:hypothetical protein